MKLLSKSIVSGVGVLICGTVIGYIIGKYFSMNLPPVCNNWNKNHIMEISLFLSGVVLYMVYELTGVNKWLCK